MNSRCESLMPMQNIRALFLFLQVVLALMVSSPAIGAIQSSEIEKYHYKLSYSGLFSLGARITAASATLSTKQKGSISLSRLEFSTKNHSWAETFYPTRYRTSSWYRLKPYQTQLFEFFLKSNKSKSGHYFYAVDKAKGLLFSYQPKAVVKKTKATALPKKLALMAGIRQDFRNDNKNLRYKPKSDLTDQLGFLQFLRTQKLSIGKKFKTQVTDGGTLFTYLSKIENKEKLRLGKKTWNSFKIKLEIIKHRGKSAKKKKQPVYLWLQDSKKRIPLMILVKHKVGRFMMVLSD